MKFSNEEIIKLADALYMMREDLSNVEKSILFLGWTEENYEVLWRLSRARFFLGQESKTKNEAMNHYIEGVNASDKAQSINPKGVEGIFWMGVNIALVASLETVFRAVFSATAARLHLKNACRIDASYHAAGPLRVLARLESKLPFFLGGSKRRARKRYLEAIEIAPTNTVTKLYFAELLLELNDKQEARKQLETILQTELDGCWDFEIKRDKKIAQELLENFKDESN